MSIRIDPEKLDVMHFIYRKLHCLDAMHSFPGYERPKQQYADAGYCLDRYSLIDAPVKE